MKKVAILLADGFEEIEALTPKDVLARAGIECDLISIKEEKNVKGAHGVSILTDKILDCNDNLEEYSMVILPGGLPGSKNLAENKHVVSIIREYDKNNKFIAAICAAPALVLSKAEIVKNRKITSYPGMDNYLSESIYVEDPVVVDKNLITSRGPATALEFSYKIVELLGKDDKNLRNGMLYKCYY